MISFKDNEYFDVLGLSYKNTVAIRLKKTQEIIMLTSDQFTIRKLLSIAPNGFWRYMIDKSPRRITYHNANDFCEAFFRVGRSLGVVDVSEVYGVGAQQDENKYVYNLGNRLLVDNQDRPLDSKVVKAKYVGGKELPYKPPKKPSTKILREFADAMKLCCFENNHARRCFTGWMVVSIIGGALKWRPHIWLMGPSMSGKSWLLEYVCKRVLGPFLFVSNDASEAGIVRKIGNKSLPVCFDEAEAGHVEHLLLAMRNASTGFGSRIRASGSSGSSTDEYRLRSCFLVASITLPRLSSQDANRIAIIRLCRDRQPKLWHSKEGKIMAKIEDGKHEIIRNSIIQSMPEICAMAKRYTSILSGQGMAIRAASQYGSLLAGYAWITEGVDCVMPADWVDAINEEASFSQNQNEFNNFVLDLLEAQVYRSKGEMWKPIDVFFPIDQFQDDDADLYRRLRTWLSGYGLKTVGNLLYIAYNHRNLSIVLKNSTQFKNVNAREMLKMGGREKVKFHNSVRFAQHICRAASVDLTKIRELRPYIMGEGGSKDDEQQHEPAYQEPLPESVGVH